MKLQIDSFFLQSQTPPPKKKHTYSNIKITFSTNVCIGDETMKK